jgi:hypothetical protein
MRLLMIIKLLARELALANFVLVLSRRDTVFVDAIAMAVFNGLGDVGGGGGFVAVPWLGGMRRIRGGRGSRRGGGGGGVVEGCGADCGGCGEPGGVSTVCFVWRYMGEEGMSSGYWDASCGAMRVCGGISTTHHVNRDDVFSVSFVR